MRQLEEREATLDCECRVASGAEPNVDACVADELRGLDAELECIQRVLDDASDSDVAAFDCEAEAEQAFVDCFAGLTCEQRQDSPELRACDAIEDELDDACADISDPVDRALDACD